MVIAIATAGIFGLSGCKSGKSKPATTVSDTLKLRETESAENTKDASDFYVKHEGEYSGGFIIFGGWTKIFDYTIPEGTWGHELYCSFEGLGVGGWNGHCYLQIPVEGVFTVNGVEYQKPVNFYNNDPTTGWKYFLDHVISCMVTGDALTNFIFFDGSSNVVGHCYFEDGGVSLSIGGGTVTVED